MLDNIMQLMEKGNPVSILISNEKDRQSPLLYCELVHKARFGESFVITSQGCRVCEYVFCNTQNSPGVYYNSTGRYKDQKATSNAVSLLRRFEIKGRSIRITPFR